MVILFDASFVPGRVQAGRESGIFRVEKAWLSQLAYLSSNDRIKVFFIVRYRGKAFILDGKEGNYLVRLLTEPNVSPRLLPRLLWKLGRKRRAIKVDLRQRSIVKIKDACDSDAVSYALKNNIPTGSWYVSVGFTIADDGFMEGLRKAGIRTAIMLHDTIPLDMPNLCGEGTKESLQRNISYNALYGDVILCNSESTAVDFRRHAKSVTNLPARSIPIVAHLGLHSECKTRKDNITSDLPYGLSLQRPVFLVLGMIEPRKNHLFLLDLWEKMAEIIPPDDMPQLVVAGRWGWKIDHVRERFNNSTELQKSIFVLEGPDDATVQLLLRSANALLMPSVAEGYGLPVLEAAREGIPVIANDIPVYREISGDYPDLIPVSEHQEWISRVSHYSMEKMRYPARDVPTWEQHFEIVLNALKDYDKNNRT
ncbi:glycosyltransferase [Paenirhodobacter populi]|uniref:glycosyltransferase n=1 Tax=Paenirhodobacter populi TaxID=2306993 RepID=UPI000FE3FCA6|nr:glycosyltransferase [Sinirhodobacter populi]RWR04675.1 glycosyltransferase family 1 protein [Sinirhodobacter populi]